MQLIFVFAIVFFQVPCIHFGKIVEIVRTLWVYTFMYAEKFPVFLGNKSISTVRTGGPERSCNEFARAEGLSADLALVLTITAIVIVDEMARGAT